MSFLNVENPQYVNRAAFATITGLGIATIGSVVVALGATSTVAMVAYGTFAVLGAAISNASMSAYMHPDSRSISQYFEKVSTHSGYAIAGTVQFIAQTLIQSLIQVAIGGISTNAARKWRGADITVDYSR